MVFCSPGNAGNTPDCALKKRSAGQHSSSNVTVPFIDHSREMWNFRCDRIFSRCPLLDEKGEAMRKTLMALAAAATLAVSAVAAPAPAQAQRGVAAGVAPGLLGGAIVGGAIASQNGYYGPGHFCPGHRSLRGGAAPFPAPRH